MSVLEQDLKEVIKKSLPSQAAGELKKFIENHEVLIKEHSKLLEANKEQIAENKRKADEITILRSKLIDQDNLDQREKACTEQEEKLDIRDRDIKLEIAELRIMMLETGNNKILELVDKVFRHPSVRVSTYKNGTAPNGVDQYGNPQVIGITENTDTTTTHSKV